MMKEWVPQNRTGFSVRNNKNHTELINLEWEEDIWLCISGPENGLEGILEIISFYS